MIITAAAASNKMRTVTVTLTAITAVEPAAGKDSPEPVLYVVSVKRSHILLNLI